MNGLFDLWPLILIIIGISFIFKKDILNTVLWGLFIAILIVYSFFVKNNITQDNNSYESRDNEEISFEMEDTIEKASLNLDIGAANFNVDMADFELIKLEQDGAFEYKVDSVGSLAKVDIKSKKEFLYNNKIERNLTLALNKDIPWELDLDTGATSGDLNLQDIMVDYVSIDMGAGDIELTMGDKNDFTSIDIDAGASKVVLNIPRTVGLRIDFDGGLSSTNLDELDLIKEGKGGFVSSDYKSFNSNYDIKINMGVGSFKLNYY